MSIVSGGLVAQQESLTVDTYRLDGTVAGAVVSTPSNAPASVPVVGNTVTINGPYKGLTVTFLRQTAQDPGTGAVAKLIANGFEIWAGSGPVYLSSGFNLQSSAGQVFNTTYTFTATGTVYVEIVVIK